MIENNRYYVIDAHCHIYPEKIYEKAVKGTDTFYGTKSKGSGIVKDMVSRGEKAGVDHYVVQSVATTPKQVQSINRFIAKEVNEFPNLLTGLGTLHPESQDMQGDIDLLCDLGLNGVKLHPDIQGFKVDDKRCFKIYELCEKRGIPLLAHTGDCRYDFSNYDRVKNVLNNFSQLTFVGAHFGGYSLWEKATEELKGYKNFYVDCSSSFFGMKREVAKKLIREYGAEKVMFGSDYPMWEVGEELEYLKSLELDEWELEQILYKNAIKIYKVDKNR